MSQSLSLSKGYRALVPLTYRDGVERNHAPLTGGEVEVGDEEIVSAQLRDDSAIEIEAKEVGQTWVRYTVPTGGDDAEQIASQLMVSVTPPRQEGERADDGPTRVDFALDQVQFRGQPKPEDADRRRERERRREAQRQARGEVDETNREAARQDRARATAANQGKTAEQLALEARGPANPLEPGGPEQPNRLAAMSAGRSPSIAAGTTADRPQDNPDDPAEPHNPGNQGGGDTTGHMLSRPGDPKTADTKRIEEDKRAESDDDKSDDEEGDSKAKSAQQRGGASSPGTTTSSPGSRRG